MNFPVRESGEYYYSFALVDVANTYEEISRAAASHRLLKATVLGFNDPIAPSGVLMSYGTGLCNMFMPISHVSRYVGSSATARAYSILDLFDTSVEGMAFEYDEEKYTCKFSVAMAQDQVLEDLRKTQGRPIDVELTEVMRSRDQRFTGYKISYRGLIKGFLDAHYVELNGSGPESMLGTSMRVRIKGFNQYLDFYDIIVKPADEQSHRSAFGSALKTALNGSNQ